MSETEDKDGTDTERDLHAGFSGGSGEVGGNGRSVGEYGGGMVKVLTEQKLA
jgi:hypothetical protein